MLITPLYIDIKNFLSYEDERFYFKEGFFLIYGKNGSGKTTIFEALLYCFTGVTFKGLKADDVIRDGQKSCKVKFVFKSDNKIGKIIVSRNPNKIIFKVGKKVFNSFSLKEKQQMIQEYFGFDFEILTKFFFVGENEKYKFSFLGSNDLEKKKLLTKISKSNIVDEAFLDIKEQLNRKNKIHDKYYIINKTKKEAIVELEQDIENEREKLSLLKKKNVSDTKILALQKQVKKYKFIFEKYKNECISLDNQIEEFIELSRKKMDNLVVEKTNLENKIRSCQNEKKIMKVRIDSIIKCEKCGNEINRTSKTIDYWKREILNLEKRIISFNQKIEVLKEEINAEANPKKTLDYNSLLKKRNFAEEKRDINESLFEKANLEFEKIKANNRGELKSVIQSLKDFKKKLSLKNKKTKKFELILNKIDKDIGLLKKYEYWFGKEGFKNYLFSKKLRLVEYTVNKVLEETGTNANVELQGMSRLKSGKFNKKIKGFVFIEGVRREYKELSKGEARKIDLSFIIAFRRLLSFRNNLNLSMYDEPFGGLDDDNLESIINMLKKTDFNTYIISPNKETKEFFEEENIINVQKINKISHIN